MDLELAIAINDATPALQALARHLDDPTLLHQLIAERAEIVTREYIRRIAVDRHATARRLGAEPTGILERAADSPESAADAQGATLTIRPGELFARVLKDVVIGPRAGKYLTIPVAAQAYGKRAREFSDLHFLRVGPLKTPVLARRAANGNMTVYYVLVKKVTQKQDRTLLPSDETYLAELEAGAAEAIDRILATPETPAP